MLIERGAYSYRRDAAVLAFDHCGPVVFMDGDCALCTRGARVIARLDRAGEFRICPIQSPLGRSMLKHYGLDSEDPESWLYLVDGKAYTSLDAIIRAGRRLGGWGQALRVFGILPLRIQDWIYRLIARNRYLLFGRASMCDMTDRELNRRLLS